MQVAQGIGSGYTNIPFLSICGSSARAMRRGEVLGGQLTFQVKVYEILGNQDALMSLNNTTNTTEGRP